MYDAASQGPRCATLKYHCRHRHVRRVSLVLAAFLSLSLSLSLSLRMLLLRIDLARELWSATDLAN